jgi:uncharacterized protein
MGVSNQKAVTVQVADRIDQFASSSWDSLCRPDTYFTASYLHALAHADLACSFRYFVAQQAGQVVGITFGYLTQFPLFGPLRPLVFITGSPMNLGFPFAFHMEGQKEEIFLALMQATIAEARKQHAALLVVRDLYAGPLDIYASALNHLGFYHMPLFQRGWIDIRWHTFEEYLADLRTHYRRELLKDMRRIKKNGYRLVIVPGAEAKPYLADMARLFRQLFLKYQNPTQLFLSESYFRAVTALPECVAFLLFRGEQLATFDLAYERGFLLDANDSGVDAALVGNHPAHRYMGYELLRYAISRGFKAVDFGTSNEASKLRLGCSLQGVNGSIYPLSPFYSVALKLHLDRWLLDDFGFKVTPTHTDDNARGWVRPTVFKSWN